MGSSRTQQRALEAFRALQSQRHLDILLAGAEQKMEQGDIQGAFPILESLKDASYSESAYARQLYAEALVKSGQIEAGIQEFRNILSQLKDQTVTRAHTLLKAAQAILPTGETDVAEQYAMEALGIFIEQQGELFAKWQVYGVIAAVLAAQGHTEEAADLMMIAQSISSAFRTRPSMIDLTAGSKALAGITA